MAEILEPQPLPATRSFKISDSALTQFARTYRDMFLADAPGFIDLNPDFDGNFASDWLAAIEAAEAMPTDETVLDIQAGQTQVVLSKMSLCRRKYSQVMYYVEEAFENNTAVQNEFGKNDYLAIRQDQNAMVTFLQSLYNAAQKYNAQLLAKGCTQEKIDEILTLRTALSNENVIQQKMIKERPTITAERVAKHNTVYSFCQKVNRASKQVFIDDYAKIQEYLLPGSENEVKDIGFTGTITRQEDATPIEGAVVEIATLDLSATTDEFGVFAFAEQIPDGTYNFTVSAAGRQPFTGSVTITDGETVTKNVALVASV